LAHYFCHERSKTVAGAQVIGAVRLHPSRVVIDRQAAQKIQNESVIHRHAAPAWKKDAGRGKA
jgi:hypothetical protein